MGMTCSKQINILPQTLSNICNPSNPTVVIDVTNPVTGKTWMDRNLGANRAAISSTDAQSYGNLYQWGRGSDGHQCVNRYSGDGVTTSGTTTTLSSSNTPGHGDFIRPQQNPFDWRSTQTNNLWQGVSGINNPCPIGYRLPTESEFSAEAASGITNSAAAFASPLKLPLAGYRDPVFGFLYEVGVASFYWSSTIGSGQSSSHFIIYGSGFGISYYYRATGYSVRCIKN
jgi:hypothetical protein